MPTSYWSEQAARGYAHHGVPLGHEYFPGAETGDKDVVGQERAQSVYNALLEFYLDQGADVGQESGRSAVGRALSLIHACDYRLLSHVNYDFRCFQTRDHRPIDGSVNLLEESSRALAHLFVLTGYMCEKEGFPEFVYLRLAAWLRRRRSIAWEPTLDPEDLSHGLPQPMFSALHVARTYHHLVHPPPIGWKNTLALGCFVFPNR